MVEGGIMIITRSIWLDKKLDESSIFYNFLK